MTNDEKLIHEFVLGNVKEGIAQTQQIVNKIDEKANNMIIISGVLITIIGSVLITGVDKTSQLNSVFMLLVLISLILCMHFAFKTVWLEDQELLDLKKTIDFLHYTDYVQAIGDWSVSVSGWQNRLKNDVADKKSSNLLKSMKFFKSALFLILFLAIIRFFLLALCS